jgi:hypothetical protein
MLPIIASILPIISVGIKYAPGLIGLFAGDGAGKVAEKVVATAKEVLGTTDPVAAEAKLAADPSLAETFAARLNADVETLRVELADVANARALGLGLVQARHWTANMPAIVVLGTMAAYFSFTACLFFIGMEIPERMFQLLMIAYGTLSTSFGTALAYYLGTTRSSAAKDEQATANAASVAHLLTGNVVPLRKAA